MGTSLNSIMDAHPHVGKSAEPAKPGLTELVSELTKVGQRHGKKDKALVQQAHDAVAELCDSIHCASCDSDTEQTKAQNISKANARHSKTDLARIKNTHDLMKDLGAECPSPKKETSE